MFSDIQRLKATAHKYAQQFIGTTELLRPVGWGVSGFVFARPDLTTVIKVHHASEPHAIEVKAYERLKQHRIVSLLGLTVPRLRRSDRVLHLIEIDFVQSPYLLDFAGVSFSKPDFSPETMAEHFASVDERFGKNAHLAYDVYHTLAKIGIYYLDLRISNLNLRGHPDLVVETEMDSEPSNEF